VDGILNGKRYLIHDRDPLFTVEFQSILQSVGVKCVKLPQSPNLNTERNHQGIGNLLIVPKRLPTVKHGPLRCKSRLGGMLNYYERVA
jgi:hypothetical protein